MRYKRPLLIILAALIVFFLISQPVAAAALTKDILDWLGESAEAIVTFFVKVLQG